MTDGYGPQLVVNGGFDSDSDWTDESSSGASASIVDGIAVLQGNNSRLTQDITTEIGKTYFIDATVTGSGSVRRVLARDGSTDLLVIDFHSGETNGAFTATSTTTEIMLYSYGSGITKFDNVSVREMPVLKWAPHNLLSYSEDFDNAAWTKNDTTITTNDASAPNGTLTVDKIQHTGQTATGLSASVSSVIATTSTLHRYQSSPTALMLALLNPEPTVPTVALVKSNHADSMSAKILNQR
jgi:hypothetical protein